MKCPAVPEDEDERLAELRRFAILDTPPEAGFDDLTMLAAQILDVPISLVSLVDGDRQWFKSRRGLDAPETPRDISFCGHAVVERAMLMVEDTHRDPRFDDNPLVIGAPFIRFYLGVPLITGAGHALGTLCVIDRVPREISAEQIRLLEALARQAMTQIELRLELAKRDEIAAQTRALEEHKDAFISLVNHELRTPLTSILGSLKLLHGGVAGALPDAAVQLVEVAERNAERLTRLVSDLLDLDRLHQGAMTLDVSAVDVVALVSRCVENINAFALDEGVDIEVTSGTAAVEVQGDRERLLRVLENLTSNALKYSPRGETVSLTIAQTDTEVRLEVCDRGPGVPAEFRDRLFDRFAQSEPSPHSDKQGSGLGLAIAHAIVQLHGGTIRYVPNQPQGARFVVTLPIAGPPSAA